MENCPQKWLIIGPQFFLRTGPAAQMHQKQKSRTTKSPIMQDWVFRVDLRLLFFFIAFDSKFTLQYTLNRIIIILGII